METFVLGMAKDATLRLSCASQPWQGGEPLAVTWTFPLGQGKRSIIITNTMSLQTRIVELEGRVRRAAAERGAVEMKKNEFQGELEKQREQLDKIQSSHNFQMESVNKLYQDEKARPAWFSS